MLLDNGTYIAAVKHVVNDHVPSAGPPPFVDHAADAARAALTHAGVKLSDVGPIRHIADLPVPAGTSPADDLLMAAELPATSHPLDTIANGGPRGVLDALTYAACYLDRVGNSASCALISAGDVWSAVAASGASAPRQNAGAALVLSVERGKFELIATATARHPELALDVHTGNADAIRKGTAALLHEVVTQALHDAEVDKASLADIITPYGPSTGANLAILRQIAAGPWVAPPSVRPAPATPRPSAVDLLGQLAARYDDPHLQRPGAPILLVADNGLGSATAAVLRVA